MNTKQLQIVLEKLGYSPGDIDGRFGPRTRRALKRFQLDHGLLPDGIHGPITDSLIAEITTASTPVEPYTSPPEETVGTYDPQQLRQLLLGRYPDAARRVLDHSGLILFGIRGWSGGRENNNAVDRYNDSFLVVTPDNQGLFPGSVDPGFGRVVNPRGVAHLLPGSYRYRLGLHRGREKVLVQAQAVRIERWLSDGATGPPLRESGWFGINIHRGGMGERVGGWSAGCQVVHGSRWEEFLGLIEKAQSRGQRRFLYTLLDGRELTAKG